MTQLMKTIEKVQRQLNPNLKIDGVLLTLADMRTKLAKTTEDSLRENYGKHIRIFKTVIPVAITAQKAVQQDREFMSMTRMELLQRRMQNLRGR